MAYDFLGSLTTCYRGPRIGLRKNRTSSEKWSPQTENNQSSLDVQLGGSAYFQHRCWVDRTDDYVRVTSSVCRIIVSSVTRVTFRVYNCRQSARRDDDAGEGWCDREAGWVAWRSWQQPRLVVRRLQLSQRLSFL